MMMTTIEQLVGRIDNEGPGKHQSVVLILMSHGGKAGINGTDGISVPVDDIIKKFSGKNCHALHGKPKIFFIQACRGSK